MTVLDATRPSPNLTNARRNARRRPGSGLVHQVAQTLADVTDSWGLVYQAYTRTGLIPANPFGIHTMPEAVGPHATVILGRIEPIVASTMSGYQDSPIGLPLDSVYHDILNDLRDHGRRMIEVGLFADRREHLNRSVDSLFDLMRYLFYFAWHTESTDVVIGVHPRHARFYSAFLAFSQEGPERSYATVNDNPVVFLRMDIHEVVKLDPLPRGVAYFLENPVAPDAYNQRFRFTPEELANSSLAGFLQQKQLSNCNN